MTNMQIEWWKLMEAKRHNVSYERETQRHDEASEGIGRLQAQASLMAAAAQQRQAELQAEITRLQGLRTLYENRLDQARINLTNAQARHEFTKNLADAWQYRLSLKYGEQQVQSGLGLQAAQTQQALTAAGFNTANSAFTAAKTTSEKIRAIGMGFDTLGKGAEFMDSAWATITGQKETFDY